MYIKWIYSLKTNDKNEKQMQQCQFCNNIFGNTQMLKQHQKKTSIVLKYKKLKLQLLPLFLLISKNNENNF